MWFKIMGSILAVTGAAGVGVMAAGVYARRLKMLLLWQQILQRLYGSMEYYAADMEDIFLELCSGAGIYETFFHNVIGKIRGRQAGSLEEIWDAAWEKFGPRVYLLPEQQQLIRQTGQGLGHMDLDSQLMALRLLQKRLEQQILAEERELGERQKIIRVLSVTAGVFVTLLLL